MKTQQEIEAKLNFDKKLHATEQHYIDQIKTEERINIIEWVLDQ